MQGIKCIITFTIDHLSVFFSPLFFMVLGVCTYYGEYIYSLLVIIAFFFNSIVALFLVVVCGVGVQIVPHAKIDGCCNVFLFLRNIVVEITMLL